MVVALSCTFHMTVEHNLTQFLAVHTHVPFPPLSNNILHFLISPQPQRLYCPCFYQWFLINKEFSRTISIFSTVLCTLKPLTSSVIIIHISVHYLCKPKKQFQSCSSKFSSLYPLPNSIATFTF